MLQPIEMKLNLPMVVANGVTSTTTMVWKILRASYEGNLRMVKTLVEKCPELIYAQYNYTPPIHLAVREGHKDVVEYLLERGALDPDYRIYPFLESLLTIAQDREYSTIVASLEKYIKDPSACKFRGDNGEIHYNRSPLEKEFEKAAFYRDEEMLQRENLMMLKDKQEVLDDLTHNGSSLPLDDFKAMYKIMLLQDRGTSQALYSALAIANDHPGVQERVVESIAPAQKQEIAKTYSR